MCGIAGYINLDGRPADPEPLRKMIGQLAHRGPDAVNVRVDQHVGLAHARLSIIDVAGGHQPMSVEDGQVSITYNGEVFNYIELRKELEALGHRFTTQSDTEVILRSYLEKGESCVRDFNGQWAFAIWDRRERKLFLSRDRLGVRPLFYTQADGRFAFASEVKAIFQLPEIRRALDLQALDQILTFWVPLPDRSVFEGIRQVSPGHSLTVSNGQVSIQPYWQAEFGIAEPPTERTVNEKKEELLGLLQDAVSLRLRSDVPVGAYLSGGIDSTVITALVARKAPNRLRTYSVTFADASFDESRYQREASEYLGTTHQEIQCTSEDIGRIFPEVIRHTEQPVLRTAPAPMYLLAKLVRDSGFKVVLTGEGSDEILGGYDIFKEAKVRRFCMRQPHSRMRPHLLRRLYPYLSSIQRQPAAYLQAFFRITPGDVDNPFFSHVPRWDMTVKSKLFYSARVRKQLADYDAVSDLRDLLPKNYRSWDSFSQAQYLEMSQLMPGYILSAQGDRMAMAHSVEGRYPFLDYRVCEFGARLHPALKMKVLNEKYILKQAARGMVPDSILKRSKQPYRAPDGRSFFRGRKLDYVDELLSDEALRKYELFEPQPVCRLVEKFKKGQHITTRDDLALVAILSTQLLAHEFL